MTGIDFLRQRGEEVAVETHGWNSDRGEYKITFSADNLIFWRTFNELHPHVVSEYVELTRRARSTNAQVHKDGPL